MMISETATFLATTLAPYLPALVRGAQVAGEESIKEFVKRVWARLDTLFSTDPPLKGIAALAKDGSDNKDLEPFLVEHLTRHLESDPSLEKDLAALVREAPLQLISATNGGVAAYNVQRSSGGASGTQKILADGTGAMTLGNTQSITGQSIPEDHEKKD